MRILKHSHPDFSGEGRRVGDLAALLENHTPSLPLRVVTENIGGPLSKDDGAVVVDVGYERGVVWVVTR